MIAKFEIPTKFVPKLKGIRKALKDDGYHLKVHHTENFPDGKTIIIYIKGEQKDMKA